MKIAFVICNDVYEPRLMESLARVGLDNYACWERVKGKAHGTEPHLGTRSFPGMDAVLMIAIEDDGVLEKLIGEIQQQNTQIPRADDKMRLFQMPLEKII